MSEKKMDIGVNVNNRGMNDCSEMAESQEFIFHMAHKRMSVFH